MTCLFPPYLPVFPLRFPALFDFPSFTWLFCPFNLVVPSGIFVIELYSPSLKIEALAFRAAPYTAAAF